VSLVEQNAQILAALEKAWSGLGPLRQINVAIRLNDYSEQDPEAVSVEEQVARFLVFARQEGCECIVSRDQWGDASVCASKTMAPTAENITALQERLKSFTDEFPRAYIDGWHYPPKKTVVFWPGETGSDTRLAQARAEVLFDGKLVNDPLETDDTHQQSEFGRVATVPHNGLNLRSFAGPDKTEKRSKKRSNDTFKIVPSEFLLQAAAKPPENPDATVSGFAQWVYSLYSSDFGNHEDRANGKEAEEEIWRRRGEALNCTDSSFLRNTQSPWKLIHNGLHLDQRSSAGFFELPNLRVNDKPLRASPDLMYGNITTSEAIIVEIKYTRMAIPSNLWPNVWAQLWCYAQLDTVVRARKLTVVGEVWGEMFSRGYGQGRNRVEGKKLICLRASIRRDPRALAYDRFFRQLFQIYAGA
jgi:hypothetical protein